MFPLLITFRFTSISWMPIYLYSGLGISQPFTSYVFLRPVFFARLVPHTGAEARERPSEHQTSVFSAIPCNQLITTWIPDPQPTTEPFSHLRQTQGGP